MFTKRKYFYTPMHRVSLKNNKYWKRKRIQLKVTLKKSNISIEKSYFTGEMDFASISIFISITAKRNNFQNRISWNIKKNSISFEVRNKTFFNKISREDTYYIFLQLIPSFSDIVHMYFRVSLRNKKLYGKNLHFLISKIQDNYYNNVLS